MTADEVVADLRDRGLWVEAVGHTLRVGPADRLTDADRAGIRRHKPALLAVLTGAGRTTGGDGGHGGHAGSRPGSAGEDLPAAGRSYYALLPNGLAVLRPPGSDLPPGAAYWCYPGAAEWTPRPAPEPCSTALARGG
jgi:hypothetical protein